MAIECGFYNAINHDRTYNAEQMSSLFDGIILDGIFQNIGDHLAVTANGTNMYITVGSGRAWFDHTWTYNDTYLPLEVEQSEVVLSRIDSVILEVNQEEDVRNNTIKILKGTPSSTPVAPTLTNTLTIHQHRLADILVEANVTQIMQSKITSYIGSSETPFISGILETVDTDELIVQWHAQFVEWFSQKQSEFDEYEGDIQDAFDAWVAEKKAEIEEYQEDQADAFTTWSTNYKANFDEWFENLQYVLDGDVAGHLQDQISGTTVEVWTGGSSFKPLDNKLMDSSGVCVTPEGKTLKQAIADGSIGGGGRTLTQAEYDALSDYEKAHGTYYIIDGKNEDGYDSTHVWYKNGTVYGALNKVESNLTEYTYEVATTDWVANTDEDTDTDYYTFKAEVTASGVNATSPFQWHMNGSGAIPTEAETESINMILEALSSTNKVTLYAIDQPTVALTLEMVGGR